MTTTGTRRPAARRALVAATAVVAVLLVALAAFPSGPADAQGGYTRISGEGSSWSANAIDAMRVNVKQFGITVDYNPSGSTAGRKNFLNGIVDFAASDIPFQFNPEDGSEPERPKQGSYAYIPVTAGGTAFIYNLKINGRKVTNLRLSGENVAKLFTGQITKWNDPAIQEDNPGLQMPDRDVVPVVRGEGSGSTAQFTNWMIKRHGGIWNDYCQRSGRAPRCGQTSFYPTIGGKMIAQNGDIGVTQYVTANYAEGAIGYVNYSYAINSGFPVAKVLNAAGYYTEPTAQNVAVSLLKADINRDANSTEYLTQILDGVYADPDPRNYQLSSYSYFILPTTIQGQFNEDKGRTLGAFTYYAMCQAQQQSESLGYSPMPINLVTASFDQIRKIPGVEVQNINVQQCNNPTFSPDGTNVLAQNAPFPSECDKKGVSQCSTGSGGAPDETPVAPSAQGAGPGTSSGDGSGATDLSSSGSGDDLVEVCDPETGECELVASGGSGSSSSRRSSEAAGPQTTNISGSDGWGSAQTLMLLVGLLVLGLVFVPALAWRNLGRREDGSP